MLMKRVIGFVLLMLTLGVASAESRLQVKEVVKDVYAIIGELGNRTPENYGNNATFGFVITDQGVVLIDSGATQTGAKALESVVASVTDKAIVKVINTGGQDHRWLGNDYFKKQNAEIIASKNAVADQKARLSDQLIRLGGLAGDSLLADTKPDYADVVFDSAYKFELGGVLFEIYHAGPAHTPGDSFVWLPQKSVMFTGDIVYIKRLLGINNHSNSKSWVSVFESMEKFKPKYVVPGHGPITNLSVAKKDTYQYIKDLRLALIEFIDNDGTIEDISKIDQSKYEYLLNFDTLSGRNAQQVFTELEWE